MHEAGREEKKFHSLEAMVAAMESEPEDPDEAENDRILMQIW
jgi:hypothetical protein